jgi:hypothetical protein
MVIFGMSKDSSHGRFLPKIRKKPLSQDSGFVEESGEFSLSLDNKLPTSELRMGPWPTHMDENRSLQRRLSTEWPTTLPEAR